MAEEMERKIAVLEERVNAHMLLPIHPGAAVRLEELEKIVFQLKLDYSVFKAQVLAYAGMGALLGGVISNILYDWFVKIVIK